jgi:hypothetical protein
VVSPIFLKAQSERLTVSKTAIYCLNKKTNSFLVFDDSTFFYSKLAAAKKWKKQPFIFKGDHINFETFKESFRPITLSNGQLFFVYKAIGEVYELKNDTLQRIDHSFKHENQFFHSLFEHNNRIYAFGGYGLFTFKNILVYFDEVSKEWFEVITPIKPPERSAQFYQYKNGVLYIFGGGNSDGIHSIFRYDCWAFHFKTKKWHKVGDINLDYYHLHLAGGAYKEHLPYTISFNYPSFQMVDIENNEVTDYENTSIQHIKFAFFDLTKKYLLLEKMSTNSMVLYTISSAGVLTKKIGTTQFFETKPNQHSNIKILLLVLSVLVFLGLIIVFLVKRKSNHKEIKKLTIRIQDSQILIGNRSINNDLTLLEFRILSKFIELKEKPMDIITLNELFEDESSSLAAQKKRRETTLKSLREKLAFFLNITQEQVFLESRDSGDKRIKLFVINPDILAV